jgi:Domain of unknown function (DUF4167)
MRQGQQHRRGRSRGSSGGNGSHSSHNHRKGQNPLSRSFESNGPDVKVRGTAADVASKYMALARDAQSSGDPVLAENYLQHAEHYNRLIIAYREQQIQQGDMSGANGHRMRTVNEYGEHADSDDAEPIDPGMTEQPPMPTFSRQPGQDGQQRPEPRHETGRHDERRSHDERRTQDDRRPQHGRQQDHRQDRGGDNPRFRDRRFDRGDRGERNERPDRGERPERSERPEHRGEQSEAPPSDRPIRAPSPAVEQPQPVIEAVETPAAREPAPSRRRERFDMMKDQPEFLRRPVRRPRREEAASDTPDDAPSAAGEPQEKPGT